MFLVIEKRGCCYEHCEDEDGEGLFDLRRDEGWDAVGVLATILARLEMWAVGCSYGGNSRFGRRS